MINKRYAVLGVALALAVIAFDRYFLMPRAETMQETIAVAQASLRKDELFIKNAVVPEKDVAAAAESLKHLETRLIPEKTEFLASVRLQEEISAIAERTGVRMMTTRQMPAVKTGNFLSVPLYFEGSGNIKQLSDYLKAIEEAPVLIKVDKLTTGITNIQNPRELKFKMQVSGVARL